VGREDCGAANIARFKSRSRAGPRSSLLSAMRRLFRRVRAEIAGIAADQGDLG
jgi:hypothetical protein